MVRRYGSRGDLSREARWRTESSRTLRRASTSARWRVVHLVRDAARVVSTLSYRPRGAFPSRSCDCFQRHRSIAQQQVLDPILASAGEPLLSRPRRRAGRLQRWRIASVPTASVGVSPSAWERLNAVRWGTRSWTAVWSAASALGAPAALPEAEPPRAPDATSTPVTTRAVATTIKTPGYRTPRRFLADRLMGTGSSCSNGPSQRSFERRRCDCTHQTSGRDPCRQRLGPDRRP